MKLQLGYFAAKVFAQSTLEDALQVAIGFRLQMKEWNEN
jgi:hypothetical protein